MPIQVSLPNGEIGEFPDGMSDAEIERVLSAQFGGKQEQKSMSWGDALKEGAGNIPSSSVRLAGDLWKSITSPIETAKALGNTALGYGQKAVGVDGEATKYADAMNAYFKDRYGSEEGFKQAVAQDPAGVMADISTVFTGVGGALKGGATVAAKAASLGKTAVVAPTVGKVASPAMRVADALNTAGNAALTAGKYTDPMTAATGLAQGAGWVGGKTLGALTDGLPLSEKLYSGAIKPATGMTPTDRAKIVRAGIDEGILPTQKGYDKLQGIVEGLSNEVNPAIAAMDASASIPVGNVALAARDSMVLNPSLNTAAPSVARARASRTLNDFLNTYGGPEPGPLGGIFPSDAQRIKKATYLEIADDYGKLSSAEKEMKKALARELAAGVDMVAPGVKEQNARMSGLLELRPELVRAISRAENANPITLSSLIGGLAKYGSAAGAGAAVGGVPGAIVGAATMKLLTSPQNTARAAIYLDRLQKAGGKVGGLLDRLPDSLNRRSLTYPAYVDRMREEVQ